MCGSQNENWRLLNARGGVWCSGPSFYFSAKAKEGGCRGHATLKALKCFPNVEVSGFPQRFVYICCYLKKCIKNEGQTHTPSLRIRMLPGSCVFTLADI